MNDYLDNLVARVSGQLNTVQPRHLSRYESSSPSLSLPMNSMNHSADHLSPDIEMEVPFANTIRKMPQEGLIDYGVRKQQASTTESFNNHQELKLNYQPIVTTFTAITDESAAVYTSLVPDRQSPINLTGNNLSETFHPEAIHSATQSTENSRLNDLEDKVNALGPRPSSPDPVIIRKFTNLIQKNTEDRAVAPSHISELSGRQYAEVPGASEINTRSAGFPALNEPLPSTLPLVQKETRQPVIKVTIGRVEVRAVVNAPATTQNTRPDNVTPAPIQALSLDEYLRQRAKGVL